MFFNAKLLERLERYDEALSILKTLFQEQEGFSYEEFEVYRVALKNSQPMNRRSIRALKDYLLRLKFSDPERKLCVMLLDAQTAQFKAEANDYLNMLKQLLDNMKRDSEESIMSEDNQVKFAQGISVDFVKVRKEKLFRATIFKEQGDYLRYIAELNESSTENIPEIELSYQNSMRELSEDRLQKHPLWLGLQQNMALFRYEMLDKKRKAYDELKSAYNESLLRFNDVQEEFWKQTCQMLKIFELNLENWRRELGIEE